MGPEKCDELVEGINALLERLAEADSAPQE